MSSSDSENEIKPKRRKGVPLKRWMDPKYKKQKPRSTIFFQRKQFQPIRRKPHVYQEPDSACSSNNIIDNVPVNSAREIISPDISNNTVLPQAKIGDNRLDDDWINAFLQPYWEQVIDRKTEDQYEQEEEELKQMRKMLSLQKKQSSNEQYLKTILKKTIDISHGEIILMCILLGVRHSLTWLAMLDIFNLVNALFKENVLHLSKYKLMNYFPQNTDWFQYHFYCPGCKIYVGNRKDLSDDFLCTTCEEYTKNIKSAPYFVTLNVKSQFKELLENPLVQPFFKYKKNREKQHSDNIEDVYDGELYRKLSSKGNILSKEWNFSYIFNTDGCQTSDSSTVSAWPLYLKLTELPPALRDKHIILAAIWVNEEKPVMQTFLEPIIKELNDLSDTGVSWNMNGGEITSKIIPLCCSVDSVCRCSILNMKQFNGKYGCTFCLHPTDSIQKDETDKNGRSIKVRKYLVHDNAPDLRTHAELKTDMENTVNVDEITGEVTLREINGVKGPSALMNLDCFDLVDGMSPDSMHCVFLGVVEQYTDIILSKSGEPYYIGSPANLQIVNERLLSIKIPKVITRTPRSLIYRNSWKASEWRSWLIIFCLICLENVLPSKYLNHLSKLVKSIHILLSDSISQRKLSEAKKLLKEFVLQFQEYFGKENMNYNVHLLSHISDAVKNLGPLSMHDAFCFENENRLLLKLIKSPKDICVQVAKRYMFYRSIPLFSSYLNIGSRVLEFIENFENRVKYCVKMDQTALIGAGNKYSFGVTEQNLGYYGNCTSYKKFIHKGIRYTTNSYASDFKIDDSIVKTSTGIKGIIDNICVVSDVNSKQIVLFLHPVIVMDLDVCGIKNIDHIKECFIQKDKLLVCTPEDLSGQCILATVDGKNYLIDVSSGCLGD